MIEVNTSREVLPSIMTDVNTSNLEDVLSFSSSALYLLVSDEVCRTYQILMFTVVCPMIDIFGTATNIINIICFMRLGLKDPVNVSLLGLSISDLGCLVTLLLTNLCYSPFFQELDLPFEPTEVQFLCIGWPHVIFTRLTSWITTLITLERCLCIVLPLKVKVIVTSKRVATIIVSLNILLWVCGSPMYFANGLGWTFSPLRNRTILGLVFTSERFAYEQIAYALNNVLHPFLSFMVVIICTVVLVLSLGRRTTWRMKSAGIADRSTAFSRRDQKVARMVVVLSALFIACFFPLCLFIIAAIFVPGLSVDGKYRNLVTVIGGLGLFLESINSSMNMVIYFYMSSKYKTVFYQLFGFEVKKD